MINENKEVSGGFIKAAAMVGTIVGFYLMVGGK
jgi:hypothetical protein